MEWLLPFCVGVFVGLIAGVLLATNPGNLKNWRDGGDK
jgi:hypothetical protein